MVTTQAGVDLQSFEGSPASERYLGEYDSKAMPASMGVIATLSMVMECDPTELVPLQSTIDTDALDAMFRESDTSTDDVSVTFPVRKYTVTVTGSGTVTVSKEGDQMATSRNDMR